MSEQIKLWVRPSGRYLELGRRKNAEQVNASFDLNAVAYEPNDLPLDNYIGGRRGKLPRAPGADYQSLRVQNAVAELY